MEMSEEIAALREALRVSHACESRLQAYALQLERQLRTLQEQHAELWKAYRACLVSLASLENHDG